MHAPSARTDDGLGPTALLAQAVAASDLGRCREAAALCRQSLESGTPEGEGAEALETRKLLACSLWELGHYAESLAIAEALAGRGTADGLETAGRIYRFQERNEAAREALARAAALAPQQARVFHELGIVNDRLERFEDAVEALETARRLAPDAGDAWTDLARALVRLGRHEDAERLGREGDDRRIGGPNLAMQRGLALIGLGRVDEGKAVIAEATDAYGDDLGYRTFASRFRDSGRSAEGERVHRSLRESFQDGVDPKALVLESSRLTCVLMGQKKWEPAEAIARAALARMAQERRYTYDWIGQVSQLGDVLLANKRFEDAERLYRDAVDSAEREGAARAIRAKAAWGLAHVYEMWERPADVEPFCRKALALRERPFGDDHPYEILFRVELGNTYYLLGRLEEAASLLERLAAMRSRYPLNTRVLAGMSRLGWVRMAQGRHGDAESLFLDVLGMRGKVGYQAPVFEAMSGLATVYRQHKRFDEGERLLRELLVSFEPESESLRALARVQQNPNPSGLVPLLAGLAALCAERGNAAQALEFGRQAVAEARAQADPLKLRYAILVTGRALATGGGEDALRRWAREVEALPEAADPQGTLRREWLPQLTQPARVGDFDPRSKKS